MAVTSEDIMKFVERAVARSYIRDKDGEIVHETLELLDEGSLAAALRCVVDLASHETGIALAKHQFDVAHGAHGSGLGNVLSFPEPRAN